MKRKEAAEEIFFSQSDIGKIQQVNKRKRGNENGKIFYIRISNRRASG